MNTSGAVVSAGRSALMQYLPSAVIGLSIVCVPGSIVPPTFTQADEASS